MKRVFVAIAVTLAAAAGTVVLGGTPASASPTCNSYSHVRNSTGWYTEVPSVGSETGNLFCNLVRGTNSSAVMALQTTLNDCYLAPAGRTLLVVDGDFGGNTYNALRYAQGVAGAHVDGSYGPETRSKLNWTGHEPNSCGRI